MHVCGILAVCCVVVQQSWSGDLLLTYFIIYGYEPVPRKQTPALATRLIEVCIAGNGDPKVYVFLYPQL